MHSRLTLAQFSQRQRPATGERGQDAGGITVALCNTRSNRILTIKGGFSPPRGKSDVVRRFTFAVREIVQAIFALIAPCSREIRLALAFPFVVARHADRSLAVTVAD